MVVTLAVLGMLAMQIWRTYQGSRATQETDLRLAELAGEIQYLDEVLTMSARMAAATGDLAWETRYRAGEARLDAAIKTTLALVPGELSAFVGQTNAANVELVALENRAFALVRNGKSAEAAAVLNSAAYEERKQTYSAGLASLLGGMRARVQAGLGAQRRRALVAVLGALGALLLVLVIWMRVLREVRAHLAARGRADRAERETSRLVAVQSTIGTLHHEINNPLQVIIGRADLALERSAEDDQDPLRDILTSAERIAELLRKLERIDRVDTEPYIGDQMVLQLREEAAQDGPPQPESG